MRVEAGTGCGEQVGWDIAADTRFAQAGRLAVNALHQRARRGAEVGAGGCARIVAIAGGGRARPEISWLRESLANEGGADDMAVARNEAPVGLRRKDGLADAGDSE